MKSLNDMLAKMGVKKKPQTYQQTKRMKKK